MRTVAFAILLLISKTSPSHCEEIWPPEFLKGAWLVTYASSDGDEVNEARDNLLIFHDNRMIFAVDRNYQPPNPEICAIGYEFYAIKSSDSKSFGLVRVQRGKLKFIVEHAEQDGNETILVTIEDYPSNRVRELVHFRAKRMEPKAASERIGKLLDNPKLKSGDIGTAFADALQDWLQRDENGKPSHESKSP